jgi:hypothetical protein
MNVNTVKSPHSYQYSLYIVGVEGEPIKEATVEYTISAGEPRVKSGSKITEADGIFRETVVSEESKSQLHYRISKDGYYSQEGDLSFLFGDKYFAMLSESAEITLVRPADYFAKDFEDTISGLSANSKIREVVNDLNNGELTLEAHLNTQSIARMPFGKDTYLRFSFSSKIIYNSSYYNELQLAGKLFESSVKPFIVSLPDYFNEEKLFSGYGIAIEGYLSCLCGDDAEITTIKYLFMIPSHTLEKFVAGDIWEQQLLKESVILMNGKAIQLDVQESGGRLHS